MATVPHGVQAAGVVDIVLPQEEGEALADWATEIIADGRLPDPSETGRIAPSLRAVADAALAHGAAMVSGLPVAEPLGLLACCAIWGNPPSMDAEAVFDIRMAAADDIDLVGRARSRHAMRPHTDSSLADAPDRLIVMAAVRADTHGGGLSELVFADDVEPALEAADDEPIDDLVVPFAWDPDHAAKPRTSWLPVALPGGGMRWHSDLVAAGCDIDEPSESVRRRAKRVQQAVDRCQRTRVAIPEGSTLVLDNHRVLHGRTALQDPKRLLRRVKLAL